MATLEAEAKSWSKDRIKVEIQERIDDQRRLDREEEEREEENKERGYDHVESGWWKGIYAKREELSKEISFLKTLL